MNFYVYNKPLLKNKIKAGLSFYNFFFNLNSFDFTLFINYIDFNFNNKFYFLNSFSHFNLGGFCGTSYNSGITKNIFSFSLNFLDFINLSKFFFEENLSFNNCVVGTWKIKSFYKSSAFNIFSNFKNFFLSGFSIRGMFLFLFNRLRFLQNYIFFLYSIFFNLFFFLIYFLK